MKDEKYKININKLEFANKILDKVFIVMVFILVFNLHYLIFGISLHLGNYFYFVKGDYKKAENTYKTALKIENKLIGQYPPIISDLLFKLYESCIMQKKYKEAKYYFDQASIII